MKHKLKETEGKVTFLLRTGNSLVRDKMSVTMAQRIIDEGTAGRSDVKGYNLCVDGKWYFRAENVKKKVATPTEGTAE